MEKEVMAWLDVSKDAAYISFKKGPAEVTTIRLSEDVALDLGPNEEIVGIEILDARLKIPRSESRAGFGHDKNKKWQFNYTDSI